jgi:hypothetical protein
MTDLAANRAGRITVRQRLKLLRGEIALLILTGVGLVISIAIGPNLGAAYGDLGFAGGFVVTLFFLMCAGMTLIGGFGVVMLLADATLGHVRSITGRPTVRKEAIRTNAIARPFPSSFAYPGQFKYKVMVGDREFDIEPRIADHLSRDTRKFRAYFAAYSGGLLSLEPLEAAQEAS